MLDTHNTYCPYCGEPIELVIDASAGDQEYIEDCFVCCRPITVTMMVEGDEVYVTVRDENQ